MVRIKTRATVPGQPLLGITVALERYSRHDLARISARQDVHLRGHCCVTSLNMASPRASAST